MSTRAQARVLQTSPRRCATGGGRSRRAAGLKYAVCARFDKTIRRRYNEFRKETGELAETG